jgi:dTDP-4-dehydrorhamnose reductase
MRILVTGKNGQLGSELTELSKKSRHDFIFMSSSECDIRKVDDIQKAVTENNIDAIINCAAYTKVDLAEDEEEVASATNFLGVKNLDEVSRNQNLKLIHISTDYVFDGTSAPYNVNDPVTPIGAYGRTKQKGEDVIIHSSADSIVIRTSWVYSSFGNNFVKTMIRLGTERNEISVVNDQKGRPTYARNLAKACLHIIESERMDRNGKIYHYCDEGSITWFDFASKIMSLRNLDCKVLPIPSSEFPTKAKRPENSTLITTKTSEDFNVSFQKWDNALKECLDKL